MAEACTFAMIGAGPFLSRSTMAVIGGAGRSRAGGLEEGTSSSASLLARTAGADRLMNGAIVHYVIEQSRFRGEEAASEI
jgi:hypothetical protein